MDLPPPYFEDTKPSVQFAEPYYSRHDDRRLLMPKSPYPYFKVPKTSFSQRLRKLFSMRLYLILARREETGNWLHEGAEVYRAEGMQDTWVIKVPKGPGFLQTL